MTFEGQFKDGELIENVVFFHEEVDGVVALLLNADAGVFSLLEGSALLDGDFLLHFHAEPLQLLGLDALKEGLDETELMLSRLEVLKHNLANH